MANSLVGHFQGGEARWTSTIEQIPPVQVSDETKTTMHV
jgi:hypothetical protein